MDRVLVDHLEWITANLELGVDGLFVCDGNTNRGEYVDSPVLRDALTVLEATGRCVIRTFVGRYSE